MAEFRILILIIRQIKPDVVAPNTLIISLKINVAESVVLVEIRVSKVSESARNVTKLTESDRI